MGCRTLTSLAILTRVESTKLKLVLRSCLTVDARDDMCEAIVNIEVWDVCEVCVPLVDVAMDDCDAVGCTAADMVSTRLG